MDFKHFVDRVAEELKGVVCSEDADLAIAERPLRSVAILATWTSTDP